MTGSTRELAATALALTARHGDLLAGEDWGHVRDESAAAAIDAARARLQGGERPAADQLAFDVRAALDSRA